MSWFSFLPDRERMIIRIIQKAERILQLIQEIYPGKEGGHLCIMSERSEGMILLCMQIGEVPLDEWEKDFFLCREQAARLFKNKEHHSSWQSRDPQHNRWAGAIRAYGYIVSFSGISEMLDEAIALFLAEEINPDDPGFTLEEIVHVSSNPYFSGLQSRL